MQAQKISSAERSEAPEIALDRARRAARRARSAAQLRLRFVGREKPTDPSPALARVLRGGRGGEVRLKLLLSFLWFQTDGRRPVPLTYRAQAWAALLGLDQPATAGARRVNEAIKWLEKNGFITVESQPGLANKITVLNETGDGTPYTPPGYAANRLRDKPEGLKHLYVQIPADLWTKGYIAVLSGAALAFYLLLLDQYGPGKITITEPVWFSPKVLADRYDLSDDTRAKGMKQLNDYGLITIKRQPINPDDFDLERIRNTYTLNPEVIESPAKKQKGETKTRPDSPLITKEAQARPPESAEIGYELKPDPLTAKNMEELQELLRAFWIWAGNPSSRTIAANSGGAFSHGTAFKIIRGSSDGPYTPLRMAYVCGVVKGCGGSERDVARWTTAWRRIMTSPQGQLDAN